MRRRQVASEGEAAAPAAAGCTKVDNGLLTEHRGGKQEKLFVGTVVSISAVAWITFGFILGSVCGGPWLKDMLDLARGYRWNYQDRCIMESPDTNSENGVDFCRVPSDCEFCIDVDQIDEVHVNDIDVDTFEQRYFFPGRPLVIRNATLGWSAMETLTYHWLKEQYLKEPELMDMDDDQCWYNKYNTEELRSLRSVFKLPDYRLKWDTRKPWYVGWAVCHPPVAQEIHKLYDRPTFLSPDSTPPKKPWIFVGTPGPGAHFHVDNVNLPSWQAQIQGSKSWYLRAPPECSWTCGQKVLQTTLYPGDIMVVDTNIWFHSTQIHPGDLSLVVTNEFD